MPDLYIWILFYLLIGIFLLLDLGVLRRARRPIQMREAVLWSCFWIGFSLLFNGLIYFVRGKEAALQFFTGYLIEKSLSVDNMFVFALIFSFFKISVRDQYKVLYWGVLGALVMRILFIFAGIALIEKFHFLLYLFGVFLLVTGLKMRLAKEKTIDPERNVLVRLCRRFFPIEMEHRGKFFIFEKKGCKVTLLFLVLLTVESMDLIFAIDSIPAIFAVSQDHLIIYTSNICAVLGLRALHFVLAHAAERFRYLKAGISCILIFIGSKMLLEPLYPLSIYFSLAVVAVILTTALLLSVRTQKSTKP